MRFYLYLKIALLTVCAFTAIGVSAVEYFPSEPGPEFVYGNFPLTIHTTDFGGFMRVSHLGFDIVSYSTFRVGPSGDVFLNSYGTASPAGPDPDETYFEPDLKYLDFPLEPSKTWTSTATQFDLWGGEEDTVTLTATVEGAEVVSVPAGDFEVVVVTLEFAHETLYWMNHSEVLWLHAQLGPVTNLESWTGVVPSQKTDWGSIKALYR